MSSAPASTSPAQPATPKAPAPAAQHRTTKESIQDVVISVIIAFALAFVFRGFVVEAFVIPTGSMAPTLMGAHERIRSPETGYSWPVGPWDANPAFSQNYLPIQGRQRPIVVHDPMSGQLQERKAIPRLAGDRILVLKYLYSIFEPTRFDVVVFKFKEVAAPEVNFIKRLVGLPGEEIALVDGDVFFRKHVDKGAGPGNPSNRWEEPGWQVARKPAVVQKAMWQPVFNSDYAPRNPLSDSRVSSTPWRSHDSAWSIAGRVYTYPGSGATDMYWDNSLLRYSDSTRFQSDHTWQIDDRYPYDETPVPDGFPAPDFFPVSDIRMSAGIEPGSAGLRVAATVSARQHDFQLLLTQSEALLRMRPQGAGGTEAAWSEVARQGVSALAPGMVTNVEFCHVDQELQAWVNGRKVCSYAYQWTPAERIRYATGREVSEIVGMDTPGLQDAFSRTALYIKPKLHWSFEGAPVKLYRVAVDRDIYYQPKFNESTRVRKPARASRPEAPMVLNDDQFFVCGDNSPQSLDARLWDAPEPFVRMIDPTPGVVPRKLMLGKAFFVYFPALHEEATVPVPDFGRMRFIW